METKMGLGAVCSKYEALLEDYLQSELSGAEQQSVAEHLGKCDGCRSALEEAKASVRLLQLGEPVADPGPVFSRNVMARIRAAQDEKVADHGSFWPRFILLGWRFAATATLALGLLVTYDVGWAHHSQPGVSANRLNDIFAPDPASAPASRDEVLMMVAETNHGQN
jgi:predicted anti-sigma-YlaC factor YlaD